MIEWMKRSQVKVTSTCTSRKLYTRCRKYAIAGTVNHFGLPTRWYALKILPNGNEKIISTHRKRNPAREAVETFAKKEMDNG